MNNAVSVRAGKALWKGGGGFRAPPNTNTQTSKPYLGLGLGMDMKLQNSINFTGAGKGLGRGELQVWDRLSTPTPF